MKLSILFSIIAIIMLSLIIPFHAGAEHKLTIIDFPGNHSTFVWEINTAGNVSGYYHDNPGISSPAHGFFYDWSEFTTLDHPAPDESATRTYGINDNDNMAGYYTDSDNRKHGFIYDGFTYTTFDVPGALDTYSYGINNSNKAAGYYVVIRNVEAYGYVYNGVDITTIGVPGSLWTVAYDINNDDVIVGEYWTGAIKHGFWYDGSTYNPLDYPGADETRLTGINDYGIIAGEYKDSYGVYHGFTYDDSDPSPFTPFTVEGAQRTALFSINNSGNLAGSYQDSIGIWHGFISNITTVCPEAEILCVPAVEYPTIQTAYDSALDEDTIKVLDTYLTEDIIIDYDISVELKGGYNHGFTSIIGNTVINGNMTITNGTITIEHIILE